MGCLQSTERTETENLYYLAKDHTEIELLRRNLERELTVSALTTSLALTASVKEEETVDKNETEESDTEVIFSDSEDDVPECNARNLDKIKAKIDVRPETTPEEFERKIYRYFNRHPYFGKFPCVETLREAQDWYRSGKISPPHDSLNIPVQHPTETTKTEFLEMKEFYTIDEHAINTPDIFLKEDLNRLTEYLVEQTSDELEQVRVIFRWITSHTIFPKDAKKKSYPPHTVGAMLTDIRQRHLSRDQLFCNMCECTGVKACVIKGMVKGVNFNAFERKAGRSSWSAVLIDKSWRLMDVGWASSYLIGSRDDKFTDSWAAPSSSRKQYNFRDFYFLCDPEEFIYTHFPDDKKWQLLARSVSEAEWFQLVEIKDTFFKLGLKFQEEGTCIRECEDGISAINIQYPSQQSCNFNYQFFIGQSDAKDYIASPEGFVYMDNIKSKHTLNLNIKCPLKGRYKLSIFGGEQYMPQLCTFYFISSGFHDSVVPYHSPDCREWGAGPNMAEHGIRPLTHEAGTIYAIDGEAEVRFKLDQELDFSYKFVENCEEEIALENCVLMRIENKIAIFTLRVPDKTEYTLSIYCRQLNSNSNIQYRHVANYLIKVTGSTLPSYQFPPILGGQLGTTKDFKQFELKQLDKNKPFMCFPEKGEVEFLFQFSWEMHFQAQLLLAGEKIQSLPEYILLESYNNILSCRVRASTHGLYGLSILGSNLANENTRPLYSALLQSVIPCKFFSPFATKCPSQLLCKLNKPLSQNILENKKVTIELFCEQAEDVAAIGSYEEWTHSFEEWTHFVEKEKGTWQATLMAPEADFELEIAASTEKGSTKFVTLYKYLSVSNEYYDKLLNVQKQRIKAAKESIIQLVKEEKLKYNETTGEMSRKYAPGDLQIKSDSKSFKAITKEETLKRQRRKWLKLAVYSASRRKINKAIQEYKKNYPKDKPEELTLAESILSNLNSIPRRESNYVSVNNCSGIKLQQRTNQSTDC